jgi:hypothetical protein
MGNHLSVVASDNVLTVTSPVSWLAMVLAVGSPLLFLLLRKLELAMQPGKPVSKAWIGIQLIATLFFLGFVASPARMTLDAGAGTVRVHKMLFFVPRLTTFPLRDVQGATVATSDQADALRLVFAGGSSLQMTPYNQMTGKGEAADAINQFLRAHGGTGLPQ